MSKSSNKHYWYAIHTYAAHEEKVAQEILQRVSSLDLSDSISEIIVPKENQIELKHGKRKTVSKKMFQGYVFIKMNLDKTTWFVIRNTPNVTGFVGQQRSSNAASGVGGGGTEPSIIADEEIENIKKRMAVKQPKHQINYRVGNLVKITDGPFRDQEGVISEVDTQKGMLTVLINVFGRETPMKLDALQVSNLNK